jgi:hypothetical protein
MYQSFNDVTPGSSASHFSKGRKYFAIRAKILDSFHNRRPENEEMRCLPAEIQSGAKYYIIPVAVYNYHAKS